MKTEMPFLDQTDLISILAFALYLISAIGHIRPHVAF